MKKIVVGLLLLGSLVAGCGKDEKPAEPEGPPLTKAQVIKQGDAICRAGAKRVERAAGRRLGEDSTRADVRRFVVRTMIPELERQVSDLRALRPPARDAPQIDAMLDAAEEGIAEARENPIRALTDPKVFAKANRIATKYGFKVCNK